MNLVLFHHMVIALLFNVVYLTRAFLNGFLTSKLTDTVNFLGFYAQFAVFSLSLVIFWTNLLIVIKE